MCALQSDTAVFWPAGFQAVHIALHLANRHTSNQNHKSWKWSSLQNTSLACVQPDTILQNKRIKENKNKIVITLTRRTASRSCYKWPFWTSGYRGHRPEGRSHYCYSANIGTLLTLPIVTFLFLEWCLSILLICLHTYHVSASCQQSRKTSECLQLEFHVDAGDLNPGSHLCVASSSPTEPSPQP